MKKLIYGGLFLALVGIIFVSCKKDNKSFVNKHKQIESQHSGLNNQKSLQSEGELHNDLLDYLLSEVWDTNRDTTEDNFFNYCDDNNINTDLIVPVDRDVLSNPNDYIDFMEGALLQCENCDEQYSSFELNEIKTFLNWIHQSSDTKSLDEILHRVDVNVTELISNSNFTDRLETFYSIAHHTMIYWAPISQGGNGKFDECAEDRPANDIDWYKVGYADCIAGFFGGHIAAAAASLISISQQL